MMGSFPNFEISDITAGALNEGELHDALALLGLSVTFSHIHRTSPTTFTTVYNGTPTGPEQATITAEVTNHPASDKPQTLQSWIMLPLSHNVTGSFTTAAGFRFVVSSLTSELAKVRIRLVGECSSSGGTMTIRLLEQDPDGTDSVTMIDAIQGDSGGVFLGFNEVSTVAPRSGPRSYVLRVKANGGTSDIRRVTASARLRNPAT